MPPPKPLALSCLLLSVGKNNATVSTVLKITDFFAFCIKKMYLVCMDNGKGNWRKAEPMPRVTLNLSPAIRNRAETTAVP
ncbi:hypothetical protein R80B4_02477 [Fibrobacteres bacterium R8-0-B4]